jgi:hypothetical protein
LKEWTLSDSRNTPSTANHEEEEIVDSPGNDGNASMPEQVKRPNQWRRKKKEMIILHWLIKFVFKKSHQVLPGEKKTLSVSCCSVIHLFTLP